MSRLLTFVVALVVLACLTPTHAAGLTPEALWSLKQLSSPHVSPDDKKVLYVVSTPDVEHNSSNKQIWIMDISQTEPTAQPLTAPHVSSWSPRWLPNSSEFVFLSKRNGKTQVWRMSTQGGEAEQITDYDANLASLVVSPDGKHIAFSAEVDPACGLNCDKQDDSKSSGVIYERLMVRHWDVWRDETRSVLFTQALNKEAKAIALTSQLNAHVPSKPFGGSEEITFSADSQSIYFTARISDKNEALSVDYNIYQVGIDGKNQPNNLTAANPAVDTQPVVSSDGRWLAYLAMERAGYESDRSQVIVKNLKNGNTTQLTQDWDRSISSIHFGKDSQSLWVTLQDTGQKPLWHINLTTGERTRVNPQGSVSGVASTLDGAVYVMNDLKNPADLYFYNLIKNDSVRITTINQALLDNIDFGEIEQFSFKGWNDETVYGYVVKPANFTSNQQYPLAFLIHGGPQGSFSNNFHYRWNPQIYAGAGYAVVMIDFHGSTGYGQAFTDSIRNDWGGKPYVDLEKGLNEVLKRYTWINGDKMCALGASYGGYMINWIAGKMPDTFDCLINHDGIFDMRSMYYTTEELYFAEWEQGGPYFKNPEGHEKFNPASLVNQWKTPMLVIHGELDYRVPIGQGLATFTALQRREIPSQLLYFKDENHWVLKPQNALLWHKTVLNWMDRWTQ